MKTACAKLVVACLTISCPMLVRAESPPLIPREILFGNAERSLPQLSPEGDQIAWLAPDQKGVQNLWVDRVQWLESTAGFE